MRNLILIILFVVPMSLLAQENKAALQREARAFAREGNELFAQKKFSDAEVAYKKALAKDPSYEIANYNLGVALSEQNRGEEAITQYEIAAKMTENKMTKAESFHNIGNQHYDTKNYQGAVDSYKNSLRNNPTDDETRYNLALAQEMLEDQQNKDDENKDDKDNKDDKENQDKNKDKQDQQDKDKKDDGEDQKDKDENEGDKDDKKQDPKDQNKDKENQDQQQKPQPGKLSPQQVEQLLEAMNNEEKKTQEKINARKEKGVKIKQEKDW